MSSLISTAAVQAWLEPTKLELTTLDDEFVGTAESLVLGKLSTRYDVTGWTTDLTTPRLVRSVVAMLVAAYTYRQRYSEATATEENTYAVWLETEANLLLEGIIAGTIDLSEVETPAASGPLFWPTAETEVTQEYKADGTKLGDQFGASRKFAMGMRF